MVRTKEYNVLKAQVNRSYDVYHSCRTKEATGIANDAQKKVKVLCPPKPASAPAPKPKPAPPSAPEPKPDSTGSDAYNQKLSEKRAESAKRYLVAKGGFDKARFSSVGYGETKPVAANNTKEGRFKNRRGEISVLSE